MATLRQAIEPHRERGTLTRTTTVSVGDLHRQFHPEPRGSTRALILKMFEAVSEKKPWAIILCRFRAPPPIRRSPRPRRSTAGCSSRAPAGWSNIGATLRWAPLTSPAAVSSIGSGSTFRVTRLAGGRSPIPEGQGRSGLVDAAIRAILQGGNDRLDGFFSGIRRLLRELVGGRRARGAAVRRIGVLD